MNKLLLLLFSLVFIGSAYASDKLLTLTDIDYELVGGLRIEYVDCREMIFLPSETLTFANQQMENLLNEIIPEQFEQLDLVLSYVLPEDNERVSNGEEPTFAELIQVKTISNDCKGATYSLFEETVANEISTLLKAEEALDQANAAIIEQEAKLSSNPEATEDKTIRVLMPHGPFIKEKNAFTSTIIDFKHQTIDGQIVETARLTTSLLVFIYDRLLNVAFYSNWFPSSDLALHESKVKQWTQDFYNVNIKNPQDLLIEPEEKKNSQSESTLIEEGMKAYDNGDFYPEAHDIWLPLARQGNAEAQFHMSLLGGVGIEYLAAKRWLTLSAEQGYAPAIYRLADNYIIGTEFRGYKKDYKKSINLYTQAAEMGHIPSQNALGEFNSYGTYSVLKNPKKGVYWYEKAAEQGSARAQYSLGIIYMGNDGISQDDKKSFYWTKKAAEQGYLLAEYNLGGYYIMGIGVIKSFKDAAYWVKKAYEGGHDNAEKMWNKYELWKYE